MKKWLFIILSFLFITPVYADIQVHVYDGALSTNAIKYVPAGSTTLWFNGGRVFSTGVDFPRYYLITMCTNTGSVSSWYSNNNRLSSLTFYLSNYSCNLPGVDYKGKVLYVYGEVSYGNSCSVNGTNCYQEGSVTFYHDLYSSWSLLNYQLSKEEVSIDYATGSLITQNQEIISSQQQINSSITAQSQQQHTDSQNTQAAINYQGQATQGTITYEGEAIQGSINYQGQQTQSAISTQTQQQHADSEKIQGSIDSESDDTTSKSCGIVCKLKGIFTGIVELPGKIINLMIDALKSLFIPTDEQLQEIIEDSTELSENFGFVGQAVSFFLNIFTSLLGLVNANGCIELPRMAIGDNELFDEVVFWEAQQVCLNDNVILNKHIVTIRTITSIALVSMFINFASSKFFKILSKSDSNVSEASV